jgi:hypothetical protein
MSRRISANNLKYLHQLLTIKERVIAITPDDHKNFDEPLCWFTASESGSVNFLLEGEEENIELKVIAGVKFNFYKDEDDWAGRLIRINKTGTTVQGLVGGFYERDNREGYVVL